MPLVQLLWDASAFVKRYYDELGRETVNALFAHSSVSDRAITPLGYAETYSILLRRYHGGILRPATFTSAVTTLQAEVLGDPGFHVLSIDDAAIFAGLALMNAHHLNASDAAILFTYLRFRDALPLGSPTCLLVASDKRLLRAAAAEGLATLNPELVSAAGLPAFLASL